MTRYTTLKRKISRMKQDCEEGNYSDGVTALHMIRKTLDEFTGDDTHDLSLLLDRIQKHDWMGGW